jgi:nucleotide-binding universal stress UspA family protein
MTGTSPQFISNIMASLALSPRAGAVAAEAQHVARVMGASLTVLHVGPDTPDNRRQLSDRLAGAGVAADTMTFAPGRPERIICRVARQAGADLIVLGALEREGPLQYYVGSVARRVARGAPCSVLLLTEPRSDPRPPRQWVVKVDFDDLSLGMLRFAVDWARRQGAPRIDVVHEYALPGLGLTLDRDVDGHEAERMVDGFHHGEYDRLVEYIAAVDTEGVSVRPVCLRGRDGWESAQHARRQGADLLMMPAPRRLTIWDKLVQQGVEFALESLPCALCLYRPGTARK